MTLGSSIHIHGAEGDTWQSFGSVILEMLGDHPSIHHYRLVQGGASLGILVLREHCTVGGADSNIIVKDGRLRALVRQRGSSFRGTLSGDVAALCRGESGSVLHAAESYEPYLEGLSDRVAHVYSQWLGRSCRSLLNLLVELPDSERRTCVVQTLVQFAMREYRSGVERPHDSYFSHVAGYLSMLSAAGRRRMLQVLWGYDSSVSAEGLLDGILKANGVWGEPEGMLALHEDLIVSVGELTTDDVPSLIPTPSRAVEDKFNISRYHRETFFNADWRQVANSHDATHVHRFKVNTMYQLVNQLGVSYAHRVAAAFVAYNALERSLGGKPEAQWQAQWRA